MKNGERGIKVWVAEGNKVWLASKTSGLYMYHTNVHIWICKQMPFNALDKKCNKFGSGRTKINGSRSSTLYLTCIHD